MTAERNQLSLKYSIIFTFSINIMSSYKRIENFDEYWSRPARSETATVELACIHQHQKKNFSFLLRAFKKSKRFAFLDFLMNLPKFVHLASFCTEIISLLLSTKISWTSLSWTNLIIFSTLVFQLCFLIVYSIPGLNLTLIMNQV